MSDWKTPKEEMPEKGRKVEVVTIWGERSTGSLEADDNWSINGFDTDLFNDNIAKWRYR